AEIDPSGTLDGEPFETPWELSALIAEHERFGSCMSEHLFKYATGHAVEQESKVYTTWLSEMFTYDEYSFRSLLRTLILSDAFQRTGDIQ
ncbi:MAG: DUF1585 domain-containing protein, partial [Myxococcota bacterium]|nr:DUF1585 domain-containing protein [Myxococcota bacterium]